MIQILKQLDVSWLRPDKPQQKKYAAQDYIDEAAETIGEAVLRQLSETDDEEVRLHDLVNSANLDFKDVLNVLDRLEKRRLVDIIERDSVGNHLLKLTPRGLRYLPL